MKFQLEKEVLVMKLQQGMVALLLSLGLVSGCATVTESKSVTNNNFNSTLWVQTSSEYKANSLQAYNSAEISIENAKNDKTWTAILEQGENYSNLPVAIILDIDETVLDNSQFQAQVVIDNTEFNPEAWDKWVAMKSAPAIPGAVEFINRMKGKGVEVIYITNRECKPRAGSANICPQEQDTIDNLVKVGINSVSADNLLLKNEQPKWTSEKKSRRVEVAKKYRVVMLFGDDLGDFLPNVKKHITSQERDKLVYKYINNWGRKWFTIVNPTYGSWLRILDDPKSNYLKGY